MFQRRLDGSTNFSKTWADYENGFGDLSGEHWLGLRKLYRIVGQKSYALRINLEYSDGTRQVANYTGFSLGDQSTGYRLHISRIEVYAGENIGQLSPNLLVAQTSFLSRTVTTRHQT